MSERTRNEECTEPQSGFDRFCMKWRRWRGYRALITPLFVVGLYVTAKTFYRDDEAAQLKFIETASERTGALGPTGAETVKPVLSGAGYETAVRLRESGALLMAISLSSFDEFRVNGKFPRNVGEILSGLQKRSLFPPGIEIKDGALRSALSELKLNYRAEPFSFEILSLPISKPAGPALLFRFPMPPTEANSVMYFQYWPGTVPIIPDQFGTLEQLSAAGWTIEHWRGGSLPLDESAVRNLQEQEAWLKSRNEGR